MTCFREEILAHHRQFVHFPLPARRRECIVRWSMSWSWRCDGGAVDRHGETRRLHRWDVSYCNWATRGCIVVVSGVMGAGVLCDLVHCEGVDEVAGVGQLRRPDV